MALFLPPAPAAAAPPPEGREVELIRDPHFRQGFFLLKPEPGRRVVADTLRWTPGVEPVWDIAQWNSRASLEGTKPERTPDGDIRLANKAKTVIVGRAGSDRADLVLGLDSRPEYGDRVRTGSEPWPHLLVQQDIRDCPPLSRLASLRLQLHARLRAAERFEPKGYSRDLHCAQFPFVLTIQNQNPKSPGHGDFFWFSICLYDDRWRLTPRYVAEDTADPSAKLIYNPGQEAVTSESLHDKKWVAFDKDILPMILDGLRAGWEKGYLKGSKDVADYRISSTNMGWEVTGVNAVEIQLRDLSLKGVVKGR